MSSRLPAEARIVSRYSAFESDISFLDISSAIPQIAFIGVLISWDIFARKSDFAFAAASASFFFISTTRRRYSTFCVFWVAISTCLLFQLTRTVIIIIPINITAVLSRNGRIAIP